MVIVFGYKVQMVDQSHRRLQPRMGDGAGKNYRVDLLRSAH
jgi:hypothetical protein